MYLNEENTFFFLGLIIMVLLIIILIGHIKMSTSDDYAASCEYIESFNLQTGDIVCVAYKHFAGSFIASFSSSVWSHTGTIWIDPITNIKYVLEGAIYRHKLYKHFFKIPFETWLYFNRKNVIGYKKYIGPPIDQNLMIKAFGIFINNCKLEGSNIFWARFLFERDYYEYQLNYKYTCIEATIILGQNIGIYKKEKIYSSYFPCDVVNNRIPTCKNIHYENVKQIKIQPVDFLLLVDDIEKNKKTWDN